ncbi:translation initiation factor IF-2 N-terminal domain-containing protein, partial [Vagococcus salmoninarum]|uniref:translation initiation factor IF-2 N-terminal domain-containing protein n=1 Tax=Vagococcus salmoninarum TaxID=2739 RepID=UPI003F9E9440
MGKKRIYELAKEMDQPSKAVIDQAHSLGIDVKNHMGSISIDQETKIRSAFGGDSKKSAQSAQSKQPAPTQNTTKVQPAQKASQPTSSNKTHTQQKNLDTRKGSTLSQPSGDKEKSKTNMTNKPTNQTQPKSGQTNRPAQQGQTNRPAQQGQTNRPAQQGQTNRP